MDSMNKNKIYGNKSNNREEASMGMKEECPQHTENENKRADKTLRCELVKPFQCKKKRPHKKCEQPQSMQCISLMK